jgi:hypothetical protein
MPAGGFIRAVHLVDASGALWSTVNPFPVNIAAGGLSPAVSNADAEGDFAKAVVGMAGQSRLAVLDEAGDEWTRLQGLKANGVQAGYALAPRDHGYAAVARGRRFFTTHQTPGTAVTGQTSFVATTPTFLLNNAAATRGAILRSIILAQAGTVAGGLIELVLAIDSANRYSAGGTAVVPQNGNSDSATASLVTAFRFNPTASAAGAGTRYLAPGAVPASLGTITTISFNDGVYIGVTGSILLYTWAATTGPTWRFTFEWEEVAA